MALQIDHYENYYYLDGFYDILFFRMSFYVGKSYPTKIVLAKLIRRWLVLH